MVMFYNTKITIKIPDDSSHGRDGAPNMWGAYMGNGKKHEYYCESCWRYIEVYFPRWDKVLNKKRYANEVFERIFRCPACINSKFVEVSDDDEV